MESRREVVETLSDKLGRNFYKDAPDALGLVDLTPAALGVDPDPIRVMVTKTFSGGPRMSHTYAGYVKAPQPTLRTFPAVPGTWNDERDEDDLYEERLPGGTVISRPNYYVNSFVDYLSRLIVTLIASVFLVVPMVVLSFVESQWGRLLSASLFIFFFAVCVSLSSKGSNQDMVLSTAAYAAVIVVFVGQTGT